MQPILLDTCAIIWMAEDEPLSAQAVAVLDAVAAEGTPTFVSPISAWEVGLLAARERLQLLITPQRWFARILELPNMMLADMGPDLLISSSFLPGKPPRDPADRIIAATARDLGAILVTRDRALIEYGAQGHLRVLAC
jgi:PIN domain nuclease of toxin-antitoxin system